MGAHFSKVAMFFVVYLLLAGSSETAVLPAWERNFREFACNFGCLFWQCRNCKKVWFSCLSLFILRASKEGEGRREDKTPGLILDSFSKLGPCFSIVFAFASVVEAAPQARPKTTAVANTTLGPSPWRALDFGEKGRRREVK